MRLNLEFGFIVKEVGLFLDLCLWGYQRGTHLMGEACSSWVSITFNVKSLLIHSGKPPLSVFPPYLSNQKSIGPLVRLPCPHADSSLRDLNSSRIGLLLGSGSLLLWTPSQGPVFLLYHILLTWPPCLHPWLFYFHPHRMFMTPGSQDEGLLLSL